MAHAQAHAADHLVEALWACAAAHTAAASIVAQAVGAAGDVLYAHYIGSKQGDYAAAVSVYAVVMAVDWATCAPDSVASTDPLALSPTDGAWRPEAEPVPGCVDSWARSALRRRPPAAPVVATTRTARKLVRGSSSAVGGHAGSRQRSVDVESGAGSADPPGADEPVSHLDVAMRPGEVGYSQSEQVARDPVSGIVYVVKTGATSLRLDLSLQPQGASASGGGVTKSGTTTAMSTARIAECEAVPAPEPEPDSARDAYIAMTEATAAAVAAAAAQAEAEEAAARRRRAATAAIYAAAGTRAVVADATAPGGFVYVDVPGSANDEDDATAAHAHCDSDPLRIGDGVTGDVVREGRTAVRASVIHHHHSVLSHVDAAAHAAGYTPAVHVPDMPPRVVWAPRTLAEAARAGATHRRIGASASERAVSRRAHGGGGGSTAASTRLSREARRADAAAAAAAGRSVSVPPLARAASEYLVAPSPMGAAPAAARRPLASASTTSLFGPRKQLRRRPRYGFRSPASLAPLAPLPGGSQSMSASDSETDPRSVIAPMGVSVSVWGRADALLEHAGAAPQ